MPLAMVAGVVICNGLMMLLRMEGGEGSFGFREQVNYLDSDFRFPYLGQKVCLL